MWAVGRGHSIPDKRGGKTSSSQQHKRVLTTALHLPKCSQMVSREKTKAFYAKRWWGRRCSTIYIFNTGSIMGWEEM